MELRAFSSSLYAYLATLLALGGWVGCSSTTKYAKINLNHQRVALGELGYFLFISDLAIPQDAPEEFRQSLLLLSPYLEDRLRAYILKPQIQQLLKKWRSSSQPEEKKQFFAQIYHFVQRFLEQERREWNKRHSYVKITRILFTFLWKSRPSSAPSALFKGKK
ncbi:MAG: hypothetical protein D6805_00365 [Planctomycetota bacterium]|nr:MAG: hypothetical protein D6805_00365 [Planctomycetota bacterium]